jgi:hypothetical protein
VPFTITVTSVSGGVLGAITQVSTPIFTDANSEYLYVYTTDDSEAATYSVSFDMYYATTGLEQKVLGSHTISITVSTATYVAEV